MPVFRLSGKPNAAPLSADSPYRLVDGLRRIGAGDTAEGGTFDPNAPAKSFTLDDNYVAHVFSAGIGHDPRAGLVKTQAGQSDSCVDVDVARPPQAGFSRWTFVQNLGMGNTLVRMSEALRTLSGRYPPLRRSNLYRRRYRRDRRLPREQRILFSPTLRRPGRAGHETRHQPGR